MQRKKAPWVLIREAEKNGFMVGMTRVVSGKQSELSSRLNDYFIKKIPSYEGVYDEDESEDILYVLNEYMVAENIDQYPLDFPVSSGASIRLLPINSNIQLKIMIVDEYYGDGDYQKYVSIKDFMITEEATENDVDVLIQFVEKHLSSSR